MLPSVNKYFAIALVLFTAPVSSSSAKDYFRRLKVAVLGNDVNTVNQLLLQNSTKWLTEERGWEIARIAAEKGNLPVIRYIAERELFILMKQNEDNETIGHISAKHGHPNITAYFLNKAGDHVWSPSERDLRKSLLDLIAEKGYLDCISGRLRSYSDDLERIGMIAAQNGHLNIACYVALEMGLHYCNKQFKDIIQTAIKNSRQRDPRTLKLFAELTDKWGGADSNCPNMVELALTAKNIELIEYLAEKKSTYFLKCEQVYNYLYLSSYLSCRPMEIAFKQNLVNRNFLDCLEKGNGTVQGYIGRSQLTIGHLAVKHRRLDVIQFLAEKNASILDRGDDYDKTVVDIAAEKGFVDIVRYAVRRKPLTKVWKTWDEDYLKSTAFHLAIVKNWMDMDTLKYVIEKEGTDLITRANAGDGETVAHAAAQVANMEILHYLVEKEPSVLSMSEVWGDTVLHILARKNALNETWLTFFVDRGAPFAVQNDRQETVGHILAQNGHADSVEYLAKKNPSIVTIKDGNGDTIVHILARNATTEILQRLAKKKPSVLSEVNSAGDTILHILARRNEMNIKDFAFFVDEGAPLLAYNNLTENIPLIASKNGNLEILQFVVKRETSVFGEGNASIGVEMAEIAASRGHSHILKFIVDKNPVLLADRPQILFKLPKASQVLDTLKYLKTACDAKITDCDCRHFESEVLREAYDHDYPDILRFMKCDVNRMNDEGEPPILTVVRRKRPNIFYYLADDRSTNLTALDRRGNNILFIAAMDRDLKKMRHILDTLKAPIDLEWRNYEGDTVLHVAVNEALNQADCTPQEYRERAGYDISVIEYLVERKHANINALGQANETALYLAASRSNYDLCNYLLHHGADPTLRHANEHNFWHGIHFPSLDSDESA